MCQRDEGIALGELYQHMASYAYEIGVKIGYVSMAGTSRNIETGIIRDYLTGKTNINGSDMFHFMAMGIIFPVMCTTVTSLVQLKIK